MLEAALFGGIPENNRYHYGYGPHQFMRSRRIPRPPSPGLAAQRLIREQQVYCLTLFVKLYGSYV